MQTKYVEWLRNYYEEAQKIVTPSLTFLFGLTDTDRYGNSSRVNYAGIDDCGRQDARDWQDIVKIIIRDLCAVGLTTRGTLPSVGETSCHSNEPSDLRLYELPSVVDFAKAAFATVGLKEDGTVVAAGSNYYGECNVNHFRYIVQLVAGKGYVAGLRADGKVDFAGVDKKWTPNSSTHDATRIKHYYDTTGWTDVLKLFALPEAIIGLKKDGTVLVTGDPDGYFEDMKNWSNVVNLVMGGYNGSYVLGVRSDNSVILNHVMKEKLSDSDITTLMNGLGRCIVSFVPYGNNCVFLKNNGTVFALGKDSSLSANVAAWKNIVAIYGLDDVIIGLKSDGTLLQTNYDEHYDTDFMQQLDDLQKGIRKPIESYRKSYTIDTRTWNLKRMDTQAYVLAVKMMLEGEVFFSKGLFETIDYYANAKELMECASKSYDQNVLYGWILKGVKQIHTIHHLDDIRYYNLNRYVVPFVRELLSLISEYEDAKEYASFFEKKQSDVTDRYHIEIGNLKVRLHNIHVERQNLNCEIEMLSGLSIIKKMKLKNQIKELDSQYHQLNTQLIKALEF